VFSYLIDPAKFVLWMGIGAQLYPRRGGSYRIDVDGEHFATGEYIEVDPPRRLVFSWGWEGKSDVAPGLTSVEIELEADGQGTILRLRHSGLPNETERASHGAGWTLYMGKLAVVVA